jgi:hypothetical protein
MDRVTLIALLVGVLGPGCKHVDGGAVEASWVLATSDGRGISDCSCACPPISQIRMTIVPAKGGADACSANSGCVFPCGEQTGATQFDITPGLYQISLTPVGPGGADAGGSDAGSCQAQTTSFTKLYQVVQGQVTQLDALQLVVGCEPACGGDDATKVCSR